MSQAQKEAVKNMKPSAYRSMLMGKLGMTKSTPESKKDLIRWGAGNKGEKWVNLTAYITDGKKDIPCGTKGKKQGNLPSVCRPSVRVNEKTPKPLAKDLTKTQIAKAVSIKKQNKRIDWLGL